jgi:hypothetical protein
MDQTSLAIISILTTLLVLIFLGGGVYMRSRAVTRRPMLQNLNLKELQKKIERAKKENRRG